MKQPVVTTSQEETLKAFFGPKLRKDEMMGRYSVIQVGGPADYLVIANDGKELADWVRFIREQDIPWTSLAFPVVELALHYHFEDTKHNRTEVRTGTINRPWISPSPPCRISRRVATTASFSFWGGAPSSMPTPCRHSSI